MYFLVLILLLAEDIWNVNWNDDCKTYRMWEEVVVASFKIQGYSKRSIQFQKFILQKLLMQSPCPVYRWKGNLSKFWYWWYEVAHHWGCGCCYLWNAAMSVGRAGLWIWHLPLHTWGSHRVLVRCENNFESSPFSLYIAHHHMLNSTCKIHFWKCILLFE
jgi:hypothetical protein